MSTYLRYVISRCVIFGDVISRTRDLVPLRIATSSRDVIHYNFSSPVTSSPPFCLSPFPSQKNEIRTRIRIDLITLTASVLTYVNLCELFFERQHFVTFVLYTPTAIDKSRAVSTAKNAFQGQSCPRFVRARIHHFYLKHMKFRELL